MNNSELKTGDLVEVYSSRFSTIGALPLDITNPMKKVRIGTVGVVMDFVFPNENNGYPALGYATRIVVLFANTGEKLLVKKEYLRQIPTSTDEEDSSNATV